MTPLSSKAAPLATSLLSHCAFVFPGQGSQSVGMLSAFAAHPVFKETLQEAQEVLGQDLGALMREGPVEELALTTNTQPVMLLAGVLTYRIWQAEGGSSPALMAGHSLGEYSALVAAGSLSLRDALPLVRLRAQAMQEAVPVGTGAMAAVLGLDVQTVVSVCSQLTQELTQDAQATQALGLEGQEKMRQSGRACVEAVNFNDPTQTVIAGTQAAVTQACERLKAAGAKRALMLPVSAPFHSSLMRPAAEKLREKLAQTPFQTPSVPVIHNVDVQTHSQPQAIRQALFEQAFSPVRWVDTIREMARQGMRQVLECGPGKVLTNLTRRIDPQLEAHAFTDGDSLSTFQAHLKGISI
jgi:[acyl-carrier-protein] S-malonyltransferase